MSNLIHCDGPDCGNTEPDERRLCDEAWLRVEQGGGGPALDFCSRDCLAAWSKPPVVVTVDGMGADPAGSELCRPVNGL